MLLALGLADLLSGGLGGTPKQSGRAVLGIGVGVGAAGLLVVGADSWNPAGSLWLVGVAVACCGWILPRLGAKRSGSRSRIALSCLLVAVALALATSWIWSDRYPRALATWIEGSAYPGLANVEPAELLLGLSVLLVLAGTANGVVRSVLSIAGTQVAGAERRLRGGRYIGLIERFLVFGLAVAGEPTAAALVVSAKSILRFPELSRQARLESDRDVVVADVDVVTEYFLLGSLTSWLLALAPVVLFR